MKTMRDTEVRLTPPMLRHALRGWGLDHLRDDELIECFAEAVVIDENREAIERSPVIYFNDGDEEISWRLHISPAPSLMVFSGDVRVSDPASSEPA